MKYEDTSIGAFFKSLLGKNENKAPVDTSDDFDAEYYRGDYKTVKRTESFTANEERGFVEVEEKREAPVQKKAETADVDDFEFVDEDDVTAEFNGDKNDALDGEQLTISSDEGGEETVEAKVKFIDGATLSDASAIADSIIDGAFTVIDISETPNEEKVRMFDFISGVVYACGGKMEKMQGGRTVLVLPEDMDMDDFKAAIAALENE